MLQVKQDVGKLSFSDTLVDEDNTWKIGGQKPLSSPTRTLFNYCNALEKGDYHTAYNQLSSDAQQAQTEADFTANFNGIKVTECTVSNVDDTAGTGTITYTLDNGKTGILEEFLVQENGTWKMKSEKAHQ